MNGNDRIAAWAAEIEAARRGVRAIPTFSSRHADFDLATGYAVMLKVYRDRVRAGRLPVGRKIGFTNPGMWARYGVKDPIWAFVWADTVESPPEGRATCALAPFGEAKIEPEIVLHFARAPSSAARPNEILACIDWIAHGFEIVHSHYANWEFRAPDAVADDTLHGRLFLGAPRRVADLGPDLADHLARFTVDLHRDGALAERGVGANVLGSPLLALAHLVAVLAKQPDAPPIAAGEIVTTGTLTSALAVQAGESWHTRIAGIDLPGLEIAFVP